jgi:hypothetical protein
MSMVPSTGERIDFGGFGTGDGPFSVEEGQHVRQRQYYHVHSPAFNLNPIQVSRSAAITSGKLARKHQPAVRSTSQGIVAHRVPVVDQVVLLGAASRLAGGRKMNMDMSRPMTPGVLHADVTLQSLI